MNLILIGPQGCGKGTQAHQIVDKYQLHHLEVGGLIRKKTADHSRQAEIIDHLTNQKGQLLPDGIVLDLIADFLDQAHYQNILFDGFPRTSTQYQSLKDLLTANHQHLDAAIYLSITDQTAIDRLSSRRICSLCGHTYSVELEPDRTHCDCSGQLITRPDDQPEAIKARLSAFHGSTQPVLDQLRLDDLLVEINGEQPIESIFTEICHHLDSISTSPASATINTSYPNQITKLIARQILDSRGWPTIECSCILSDGQVATAAVPSGASTGSHEAIELRDGNPADYLGNSVHQAVGHVNNILGVIASGHNPDELSSLDQLFIDADGTPNKSNLGANAILAASLAITKAGALAKEVPLYQHLADLSQNTHDLSIPTPIFNLINGGMHAGMNLDFQEFIIIPDSAQISTYSHQLAAVVAIFHQLHDLIAQKHQPVSVGDEGGFAPSLSSNQAAIDLLAQAVEQVNLRFKDNMLLGLDLAANTYFQDSQYHLKDQDQPLNPEAYFEFLSTLIDKYQPFSFEDPFPEDDWESWRRFTGRYSHQLTIIGDDLLVTNKDRLQQAIDQQACNAILIKLNQIGTVSETIEVMNLAQKHHFKTIVSHRSGETNDDFVADFAVGIGSDMVKFGAPDRGERVSKYNRLLSIESELSP